MNEKDSTLTPALKNFFLEKKKKKILVPGLLRNAPKGFVAQPRFLIILNKQRWLSSLCCCLGRQCSATPSTLGDALHDLHRCRERLVLLVGGCEHRDLSYNQGLC